MVDRGLEGDRQALGRSVSGPLSGEDRQAADLSYWAETGRPWGIYLLRSSTLDLQQLTNSG
jgi:hypothetical protein